MKRKKAAALKYNKSLGTPVVTAVGFGNIAENIIRKAEENDVPVVENSELVDSLTTLSVGQNIPPELYEAVAEIIAFIYNLDNAKDR